MKKVISVLLIMIFVLAGCGGTERTPIENDNWILTRIIDNETDETVFCSANNEMKFPDAKVIELECIAKDSKITIKDKSSGEEWILGYSESETAKTTSSDGKIYDITFVVENNSIKGFATTGALSRNKVDKESYLIITIGGYELNFTDTAN